MNNIIKTRTFKKNRIIGKDYGLLFALLGLLLITLSSCELMNANESMDSPEKFITTFYLEIDDGKHIEILEGTSKSDEANWFSEYPDDKLQIISYNTFGNNYDEVKGISGMILLDENKNLYPFGEMQTSKEFKTGLVITTNDKYIESLMTGTHLLTGVKYYTRDNKKGQGKVAFRYEFDKVLFEDRITNKNYTVSGHIISVAEDEYTAKHSTF